MEYRVTWEIDVDADTPEQAVQTVWDHEFGDIECPYFKVQPTADVGNNTAPAPITINAKTGAKE